MTDSVKNTLAGLVDFTLSVEKSVTAAVEAVVNGAEPNFSAHLDPRTVEVVTPDGLLMEKSIGLPTIQPKTLSSMVEAIADVVDARELHFTPPAVDVPTLDVDALAEEIGLTIKRLR